MKASDAEVQQISESNFKEINESAEITKAQGNRSKGMSDICTGIMQDVTRTL